MADEEKQTPATESSEPKKEEGKTLSPQVSKLLSILVLVLLAGAIAAAAYFAGKSTDNTEDASPSPTATSEIEVKFDDSDDDEATSTPSPTLAPTEEPTSEPTPEPKADLKITEYSFDPTPEKQVPFTATLGLYNQGDAPTGPFWWEWWPTYANYACREHISGGIAAGGERIVTCDYEYGGWSNYETKVVADADNDVDESDESNNIHVQFVVPIH